MFCFFPINRVLLGLHGPIVERKACLLLVCRFLVLLHKIMIMIRISLDLWYLLFA